MNDELTEELTEEGVDKDIAEAAELIGDLERPFDLVAVVFAKMLGAWRQAIARITHVDLDRLTPEEVERRNRHLALAKEAEQKLLAIWDDRCGAEEVRGDLEADRKRTERVRKMH